MFLLLYNQVEFAKIYKKGVLTMNEWIELFTKIITGEKSRYFWVGLIVVAILAIIIFPYVDANILYYDRIEKRIDNL